MPAWPPLFTIMLRRRGETVYRSVGRHAIGAPCASGDTIAVALEGANVTLTVDRIFVPPQCEEHCIGTIFVAE